MPAVLLPSVMVPVVASTVRPVVELKAPPLVPVTVGIGLVPDWQKGEPL